MERQKLAICSLSLGWDPSHILERKVSAIKAAGFQGIEMFMAEIDFSYAKAHNISRIEAARGIRKLCAEHGIEIVNLAAFSKFEGQPSPLEDRLKVAKEWLAVAKELGTTVIQIPSNDSKEAIGDEDVIVSDLRALADLGLREDPPVSFAYEALAWSTHVADWEESLRIVQLVDRTNFGLCLDTFHVLSRLWADPRAHSGLRAGGNSALRASLQRFRDICPKEKIIYMQLSDAEKLSPPLLPGHPAYNEEWDGPHSWNNYGRLFPLESDKGAYLPMEEISRAWLVNSGWTGWVSMEIFHRDLKEVAKGPEYWAQRGRQSWDRLIHVLRKD
jgi:sugar phosphate isomerase/epimerase